MDVRRDYRLLVAEHALDTLESIIRGRRIPAPIDWVEAERLVREARGLVKRMRFSFMPPSLLARSEEASRLRELARRLVEVLAPREWVERLRGDQRARMPLAQVRYAARTLYTLPARLALGDENEPLYAVDIECVRVVTVSRIRGADRLYVTKAQGALPYTIVTNLQDVKQGEVRAAAILPPREFHGYISEAMYCSRPLEGCEPGRRPPLEAVERGEVARIVYEIASRVH